MKGLCPRGALSLEGILSLAHLTWLCHPDSTAAFYGGKPLLNVAFIRLVMDGVDARFVIQTNELLARRLEPKY